MYVAYEKKNDSPAIRALAFMAIFHLCILMPLLIYLEKLVVISNLLSKEKAHAFGAYIFWGCCLINLLGTFFIYNRQSIIHYEEIFSKWENANRYLKIWMIIPLPFLLFLGSIHIYILLFGGQILGKDVIGVFS
jgi:hypothetical protein